MFQLLLALLGFVFGDVINRFMLTKKKLSWKKFITISYLYYGIILIPFIFIFSKFDSDFFNLKIIFLFVLTVILTMGYSIFRNIGFQNLDIVTIEPLLMSNRAFAIILAFIIFTDERNIFNFLLAFMVLITVFLGNVDFKRFKIENSSNLKYPIIASVFGAFNAIVIKELLFSVDIFLLACLRALTIGFILFIFFKPSLKEFKTNKRYFSLLGFIDAFGVVFILWSYREFGIILTQTVIATYPLFTSIVSKWILKEKIIFKKFFATFVAVILIIISILY